MNVVEKATYLGFCSLTIALFVFINATQPFLLTSLFPDQKQGLTVSRLALADELINVICAPFWGALSDKIGTRYVAAAGTVIMGVGLVVYPHAHSVYPDMILCRMLFSWGGSAAISMVTAILSEHARSARGGKYLNSSGDGYGPLLDADASHRVPSGELDADFSLVTDEDGMVASLFQRPERSSGRAPQRNGTMAGLTGLFSGLGAVLSVMILLPLPTKLGYDDEPVHAIRLAYLYVGVAAMVLAVGLLFGLYQDRTKGFTVWLRGGSVSIFDEAALDVDAIGQRPYFSLLKEGFFAARKDRELQFAYYGSAVARASSIAISLFLPLYVNDWFYKTGRCSIDSGKGCRDGYVQSEILSGIANTATLVGAPVIGWAINHFNPKRVLAVGGIFGAFTMLAFVFLSSPLGLYPILLAIALGVASISVMTDSMAMTANGRREFSGSIAGVYSLAGGLGIILLTQLGGPLADAWIKSPFLVMSVMFTGLIGAWLV